MSGPCSRPVRPADVPGKVRHLVEEAEALGFRAYRRRSGHLMFRHNGRGRTVFAPGTPSDWRAEKNVLADLRRSAAESGSIE